MNRDWQYHPTTRLMRRMAAPNMPQMTHLKNWVAQWFVMSHVHWNGNRRHIINDHAQALIYRQLADGFGKGCAPDDTWDWSHIRDSSDGAYIDMAEYISQRFYAQTFNAFYRQFIADFDALRNKEPDLHPVTALLELTL